MPLLAEKSRLGQKVVVRRLRRRRTNVSCGLRWENRKRNRRSSYGRVHYNYYRTYDPATGRYLESDPIGLAAGLNTYSYVGNMPTMYVDPFGLDPFGLDYFKCMLFGGNDPSCRGEIEDDIEEKVKNLPGELLDASASLAKDAADDVGACTACVVECTFSAVVGDSPEEVIATASKETMLQHIDWVAKGTLGDAAAKSLTRRLRIWEAPMQLYDFATCQCKALD